MPTNTDITTYFSVIYPPRDERGTGQGQSQGHFTFPDGPANKITTHPTGQG
jgi:hypothetical protein